ncbi:MAG TPA: peptidylprolyl isomerase [Kofleriaceae bacterium]|nr:peptidylprolyl isomerase [Kofleriaceae bacterium]
MQRFLLLAVLIFAACQKVDKDKVGAGSAVGSGSATTNVGSGSAAAMPPRPATPTSKLDSKDILARTETAPEVMVKHVLFGWKDLAAAYRGQMDPRAANRTQDDAEKLAADVAAKLKANPKDIDALVKQHSEDPGAQTGNAYTIKADTPFVPEFKNLAMRLKMDEVGIVTTSYGLHVTLRVPPPPPDPLESADILSRPAPEGKPEVFVQHVLLAWKGTMRAKPDARSKEEADKLATEILAKVKAGGDMAALMKQYSEDPGSKDSGRAYPVTPGGGMVAPFENLSLRLKEGEAGLVKTDFGWHVIKRVPPPPPPAPDSLDSVDILKREPKTESAKVKHILVGWKEVNADDERAKKRDRKTLEKLVKDTVAKLKKGDKIEPLMAELSEDPGSAKSGESYPVTPTAGLVEPFKKLSLRLDVNEVGVVKTDFGIHIIQRVE